MNNVGKIIVLISSKGGSGKSTVAVGLATAFSNEGKKVLLIDADEGARCLDSMLAVDSDTLFDISDVLKGNADISSAALSVPKLSGVSVIPSPLSGEALDLKALGEFAESQKEFYDFILIDTKGQLPAERLLGIPKSVQMISVVTTDRIAIRNTGILNRELVNSGYSVRLVINRFKRKNADRSVNNIDNIIDETAARLIGIVPEDRRIGSIHGPILTGTAAKAIFRIAGRVSEKEILLPRISQIT